MSYRDEEQFPCRLLMFLPQEIKITITTKNYVKNKRSNLNKQFALVEKKREKKLAYKVINWAPRTSLVSSIAKLLMQLLLNIIIFYLRVHKLVDWLLQRFSKRSVICYLITNYMLYSCSTLDRVLVLVICISYFVAVFFLFCDPLCIN